MTPPTALSVVIPTYDRQASLLRTIESLQHQDVPLDILVIDNAASGTLREVVSKLNGMARIPARWIAEPRLGLQYARNTGALHASSDLIAFVDDDVTFAPGWARAYLDAFAAHPAMVAAGGPSHPVWVEPPPAWLVRLVESRPQFPPLSLRDFGPHLRTDERESFWGLNMVIRKAALVEVGGFPPDLVGERSLGDGEGGVFRMLLERGASIGYIPQALVRHHIPPERSTIAYLRRRLENTGGESVYTKLKTCDPRSRRESAWLAMSAFVRMLALAPACALCTLSRSVFSFRVRMRFWEAQGAFAYALWTLRDPAFRSMIAHAGWISETER